MDQPKTCRRSPVATKATIADITDDILIEILVRLSTKSLIQLKSVCRQWCSLISGHNFSLLHAHRHRPDAASAALLLPLPESKIYHLSLESDHSCETHLEELPHFTLPGKILQSCHGLLLCWNFDHFPAKFYIYNPATRLCRTLAVHFNTAVPGLTLVFDPSKSASYKIICVRTRNFSVFRIEVFDSMSCSWSRVVENFTAPYDVKFSNGVYWNNAVHWSTPKGELVYFIVDKGMIGKFVEAPLNHQRSFRDRANVPLLVESGGHLHFIVGEGSDLTVYEMERDYSKWFIKYRCGFDRIPRVLLDFELQMFCLLGITRRPNDEESSLLFHAPGSVEAFKFSDKSFKKLVNLITEDFYRVDSLQFGPCDVHQFVATLTPV